MERLSYLETSQRVVALPALCSSLSITTKLAFFWPLSWGEWHFNLIALLKTNPNQTSQLLLLKASPSKGVCGSKAQRVGHPVSSAAGNAGTSKGERGQDETRPLNPRDSESSESSYTLFLLLLPSVSSPKGSQEFPDSNLLTGCTKCYLRLRISLGHFTVCTRSYLKRQ